jgi:hypothetical protein
MMQLRSPVLATLLQASFFTPVVENENVPVLIFWSQANAHVPLTEVYEVTFGTGGYT